MIYNLFIQTELKMNYGNYAASSASNADEVRGRSPLGPAPETQDSEKIAISGLQLHKHERVAGSNRTPSKQANADLPGDPSIIHVGLS